MVDTPARHLHNAETMIDLLLAELSLQCWLLNRMIIFWDFSTNEEDSQDYKANFLDIMHEAN
jgi:hypothetical protein